MTETDWHNQTNPVILLSHLGEQTVVDLRRLRLFGVGCFHRIWGLIDVPVVKELIELSEAFADGEVTAENLACAVAAAGFVELDARSEGPTESGPQISKFNHNLIEAVRWITSPRFDVWGAAMISQWTAGDAREDFFYDPKHHLRGSDVPCNTNELMEQVRLFRDIFRNPYRSLTFEATWRTHHTIGIAAKMYEERNFDAISILADALQEVGCNNEDILRHCSEPSVHVRGCWLVDLVLSKNKGTASEYD